MGSLVRVVKVAIFFKIHFTQMMESLCHEAPVFGVYCSY